MTAGERAAARAAKYQGTREVPMASNRGPDVDRWQAPWGMGYGWPWCGAYAAAMVAWALTGREDDVHDPRTGMPPIGHPSTQVMADRAKAQGAIIPRPIPGAYLIWPGTHVAVCADYSPDSKHVVTYEGNSGHMVARRVRAWGRGTGTIIAAPPGIRVTANPSTGGRRYYVEDTAAKRLTRTYGPWRTKAMRERALKRLPADKQARARRVRIGRGYAFEVGPRRVYGPWATAAARDRGAKAIANSLGRAVRRYSLPPAKRARLKADALGETT